MARKAELNGGMTAKEARFVAEYLIDFNLTAAAKRAGYAPKNARTTAQHNMRRPIIQKALADAARKYLAKTGKTAQDVLDELVRIGFSDIRQVMSWSTKGVVLKRSADLDDDAAATIAEVSDTRTKDGGTVKVKLHGKLEALDRLGRHFQLFGKDEPVAVGQRLILQVEWPDGSPVPARIKKL